MPRLIRDRVVIEDDWQGQLLDPVSYNALADDSEGDYGVILQPDQPPSLIESDLSRLPLVAIYFPVFTDGRCFSYARELRELGYGGEIRATGHFIRDQLFYLQRCGFNAFQFEAEVDLEAALSSLVDFSDAYQAGVDQPEPLFLRRG